MTWLKRVLDNSRFPTVVSVRDKRMRIHVPCISGKPGLQPICLNKGLFEPLHQGTLRAPSSRDPSGPFTEGLFDTLLRTLRVQESCTPQQTLCVSTHNNGLDKDAVPLSFVVVITQGMLRISFPRSSVSNIWISSW